MLRREFSILIGAGTGCDDIGYDDDPLEHDKLDEQYQSIIRDVQYMARVKKALKIIHNNPDWLLW